MTQPKQTVTLVALETIAAVKAERGKTFEATPEQARVFLRDGRARKPDGDKPAVKGS